MRKLARISVPRLIAAAAAFRLCCVCGLLSLSALPAAGAQPLGQPYFESVPGTEKIGNGIITVIAQDQRGLIWLGTPEGLYSFDGYRLRAYRNVTEEPDSIGDDYVRGLLAHSDGRLWVATQSAGLSIYDPRRDRFERQPPDPGHAGGLPGAAVLALAEAANGDVWIGFGRAGLARWDHASGRFESFPPNQGRTGALQHDTVRSLLFDRRGDLWIGTGTGLQRKRKDSPLFEHIVSAEGDAAGLSRQYVYALFEASDGRIWIGTQASGAAVLDPDGGSLKQFPPGAGGTGHPWISGFSEPVPGQIWVHTYGGGIDVVDARSNRVVSRVHSDLSIPGGLTLDRLTAPLRDRSGLIWLGTWGAGAQHYNPYNAAAFRSIRHSAASPTGLSAGSVMSTLPLDARTVLVGTGGAGIDVLDLELGVVRSFHPDPQTPGNLLDGTIRALELASDGSSVWVGTQQAGVQSLDLSSGEFSEPPPSLPRGPVRQLELTPSGLLAVGMQAGLVLYDPASGKARRLRTELDQDFTDAVWSLLADADGHLWVSTPNALLWWSEGSDRLQQVHAQPDWPLGALTDMRLDAAGTIWVTGPRGVARLTAWQQGQPRFERYGREHSALSRGSGQQMLPDKLGRLWSTQVLVDPRSDSIQRIGVADGIDVGSVEIGSGSVGPDGLLYFGGTRGLLIVDPSRFSPWRYDPPLLFTRIDVDGRERSGSGAASGLHLASGQRRFSAEFAALDYSAPTSIRYAYRLRGLDEDWTDVDAGQRIASYNNLWPGSYQLEVRARLNDGDWSGAPLLLPVTVAPVWWQRPASALLALLALAALIGLGMRWRTRKVQARAEALEVLVEKRTRELSLAKSGAEHALSDLRGAQKQLVAAEKMASLGQLVAGVAHEINTPIGIAITAASHLDDLARSGKAKLEENRFTRNDLSRWKAEVVDATRLIQSSLQRAGELVASFKQVSVDQSSGQRRTFLLDDFLREVQTTLNPGLRRTPHTLICDCPERIELDSYPGALFQILTNLINNAQMHAFSEDKPGHMWVGAQSSGEALLLRFSDDGRGMPEEVAAHAFDPFFTTKRGSGGSGLGLHVVHNLVTQLLGGEIELRSKPGQGTEFLMRFARRTPEPGKTG
jgi:signal transduction histidine kinase/ligand-binding sensor domain-containing protein